MTDIDIKFDDSDLKQFLGKFKTIMPEEMRIGILNSLDYVGNIATAKYMKPRTVIDPKTGAVGARSGNKLNIMTGRLARSINKKAFGHSAEGIRKYFKVGKDFGGVLGTMVPYARIHEKGGATSPHTIYPKNKSVLVFRGADGNLVFAKKVNHPESNIPARPYLEPAVEDSKEWILNHLKMQLNKVVARAEA